MFALLILVIITTFAECITREKLRAVEGEVAFLNFSYSCNSTKKITLRHGDAAFYNSRNPSIPSPSNLKLRNETDGEICFLYLTIDPVLGSDKGNYLLTALKYGPKQVEYYLISLSITYPPGEASCVVSEEYIDKDWFILHCTAPPGNTVGRIICYQNDSEILIVSPFSTPQQHDEALLSQTLWAKVVPDLVYCCSSTWGRTKDRCECKDSIWDPIQNKEVTNFMDPCPPTLPIQYPTFSQHPTKDSLKGAYPLESTLPSTPDKLSISQKNNSSEAMLGLPIVVYFLILLLNVLLLE